MILSTFSCFDPLLFVKKHDCTVDIILILTAALSEWPEKPVKRTNPPLHYPIIEKSHLYQSNLYTRWVYKLAQYLYDNYNRLSVWLGSVYQHFSNRIINSEIVMSETPGDLALIAAENYEKNVVAYTTGPFAAILLEYAQPLPGENALDVACGTGIVARLTAPLVGKKGTVAAVDVNPAMLSVARSLPAPEGAAIDWREGSAQALPLQDESIDLVLCQAGLQFFPDRPAAVHEMYRVLRSGGRVAISVWRSIEHNPASAIIWGAIAHHLNTTTGILARGFSLGDAGELSALLESAGFASVSIVVRDYTVREPYNPQLIATILSSVASVIPAFAAMSSEEKVALTEAVKEEVRLDLETYVEEDQQLYPMSVHIATASKR
jgi:ubiquinone/menaquinone biosynthesis C-methylase UbiE